MIKILKYHPDSAQSKVYCQIYGDNFYNEFAVIIYMQGSTQMARFVSIPFQNTFDISAPLAEIEFNGNVGITPELLISLVGFNLQNYNPDEWQPNPFWPSMPNTDDRIHILWAVFDDEPINGCEIVLNSNFIVNWGDGHIDSGAADTKSHSYDYNSISGPVIKSYDDRNYKVVIIEVDRNGGTPTILRINRQSYSRPNNALIINDKLFGENNLQSLNYDISAAIYLESCQLTNKPSDLSVGGFKFNKRVKKFLISPDFFTGALSQHNNRYFEKSFDKIEFNLDVVTQHIGFMFNCCGISKIGNVLCHTAANGFEYSELEEIGNFTASGTATGTFGGSSLRRIGLITITSVSANTLFENTNVEEVVFTNAASITTAVNVFKDVSTLRRLVMPGLTIGISVLGNKMQAAALNEFMSSIGIAAGWAGVGNPPTQIIDIRFNPGAATCDTSIATHKGFSVIIA